MTNESAPNDKILEKIEKLLALAQNNTSEHEAALAMEKVQTLLADYNLTLADVTQPRGDDKREAKENERNALYDHQVRLMRAVAEANFCTYRVGTKYVQTKAGFRSRKFHRLIGRQVNVIAAQHLFDYLNSTIERLAMENYPHPANLSKPAISWKIGCAFRLIGRLADRRREADEAQKAKAEAAKASSPTANALVLLDTVRKSEEDANRDFINGWEPGTSALRRAQALAEMQADHEKEALRLAGLTPKERAKEEAAEAKAKAKWSKKADQFNNRFWKNKDMDAYFEGHKAGNSIGLDEQVAVGSTPRIK